MAEKKRGNSTRRTSGRSSGSKQTQARSGSSRSTAVNEELDYTLKSELVLISVGALAIFLFLCNFGICGTFGNAVSSVLFGLFGITAFVAPILAAAAAAIGIANYGSGASIRKIVSGTVIFFIVGILADLLTGRPQAATTYDLAGIYSMSSQGRNGGGVAD